MTVLTWIVVAFVLASGLGWFYLPTDWWLRLALIIGSLSLLIALIGARERKVADPEDPKKEAEKQKKFLIPSYKARYEEIERQDKRLQNKQLFAAVALLVVVLPLIGILAYAAILSVGHFAAFVGERSPQHKWQNESTATSGDPKDTGGKAGVTVMPYMPNMVVMKDTTLTVSMNLDCAANGFEADCNTRRKVYAEINGPNSPIKTACLWHEITPGVPFKAWDTGAIKVTIAPYFWGGCKFIGESMQAHDRDTGHVTGVFSIQAVAWPGYK